MLMLLPYAVERCRHAATLPLLLIADSFAAYMPLTLMPAAASRYAMP